MNNWSDITSFATKALKETQKRIDKALDIEDEPDDDAQPPSASSSSTTLVPSASSSNDTIVPDGDLFTTADATVDVADLSVVAAELGIKAQKNLDKLSGWFTKVAGSPVKTAWGKEEEEKNEDEEEEEKTEVDGETSLLDEMHDADPPISQQPTDGYTTVDLLSTDAPPVTDLEPELQLIDPSTTAGSAVGDWMVSSWAPSEQGGNQGPITVTTTDSNSSPKVESSDASPDLPKKGGEAGEKMAPTTKKRGGKRTKKAKAKLLKRQTSSDEPVSPTNLPPDPPPSAASMVPSSSASLLAPSVDASDIEIVSNMTDVMSERSSRSGVVVDVVRRADGKESTAKSTSDELDSISIIQSTEELSPPESENSACVKDGRASATAVTSTHNNNEQSATNLGALLEARELKLIDVSRDNMRLQDECSMLRHDLVEAQQKKAKEGGVDMQLQINKLYEERASLRKKWEASSRDLDSSSQTLQNLQRQLLAKDETNAELTHEGERLAKQELKHTTIIKKLRTKEKEQEKAVEGMSKKQSEIDTLKSSLKEKRAGDIKTDQKIYDLQQIGEKLEKQLKVKSSLIADYEQKMFSQQNNVESVYKQLSEAHKSLADSKTLQTSVNTSRDLELRNKCDALEKELMDKTRDTSAQNDMVTSQLSQSHADAQRVQQSLKWDVEQLQKKLRDAEARNEELSGQLSSATQPLVRQTEALRSSHAVQQTNWEQLEQSLYGRLKEMDVEMASMRDKESTAIQSLNAAKRDAQYEKSLNAQHSAKIAELVEKCAKNATFEREVGNLERAQRNEIVTLAEGHERQLEEMAKEKELMTAQGDFERNQQKAEHGRALDAMKKEVEKGKSSFAGAERRIVELESDIIRFKMSNPSVQPISDGLAASDDVHWSHNLGEESTIPRTTEDSYANAILTSDAPTNQQLEQLRQRLNQRNQEDDITRMRNGREQLAAQLATARRQLDDVREKCDDFDTMATEYATLDAQHQQLLQLHGEKMETIDELQMDLVDIKLLLKQQCESLATGD